MPKDELTQRIDELLDLVGLQDARHRRVGTYSKGMLQRIGLAQALIQNPQLIILDEPTAGVDPTGSRQIRDLILALKERGITIFLCSHLLEQVQEVCDHIGIIHHGKIVKQGPLEELIAIEDQTEIILQNASPELLTKMQQLVAQESADGASWLKDGKPRTTLERLYIQETSDSSPEN